MIKLTLKRCFALLALMTLCVSGIAAAASWDRAALAAALQQGANQSLAYEESYHLSAVKQPVDSRGQLFIDDQGTFVKQQTQPAKERFEVDEHVARVYRDGVLAREVSLREAAELKAMLGVLRHLLRGDLDALAEDFELDVSGVRDQWRLRLSPRSGVLLERIQRMEVSGQAGRLTRIELHERSGDKTVTQLKPL